MKVFTRTASGIANSPKFFNAEFIAYVEGQETTQKKGRVELPDVIFFTAVLNMVSRGNKFKVKCIGCKQQAFEMAKKIQDEKIPNSIVVVDKDLEGVLSSPILQSSLIRTFGYSWENEIWSLRTISEILENLTHSNEICKEVENNFPVITKQLKFISALDAAAQVHSRSIINKGGSLSGVTVQFAEKMSVSSESLKRCLIKSSDLSLRKCCVSRQVFRNTFNDDARKVCQGHFWSNVWRHAIGRLYKINTGDVIPSNSLLLSLAFAFLQRNPREAVGSDVLTWYQDELDRVIAR